VRDQSDLMEKTNLRKEKNFFSILTGKCSTTSSVLGSQHKTVNGKYKEVQDA
jgi:hypothetical protein